MPPWLPLLIAAAIWYLVITSLLMWIQSLIEKHFAKGFERRDNTGGQAASDGTASDEDEETNSKFKFMDVTP